jgi:predicted DNA-binding transcriptional regulator AlpA
MTARVKLPPGPLLEYQFLCQIMAEAVFPTRQQHFKGIECVVGKIVRCQIPVSRHANYERWWVPALQSVLLSDDGRTLDQLAQEGGELQDPFALDRYPPDQRHGGLVELPLPYALDASDRKALVEILPLLPQLSYPISQADEAAFLEAYISLKNRPAWEPTLISDSWMSRRKNDHKVVLQGHQQALREALLQGRLQAVNAHHVPVPVLSLGSFIPRQQAVAYLAQCGCALDEPDERPSIEVSGSEAVAAVVAAMPEVTGSDVVTEALFTMKTRDVACSPKKSVADQLTQRQVTGSPTPEAPRSIGKVLRLRHVEEMTGLKRSSIYYRMDPRSRYYDPTFPRCFSLSTTESGAVGWDEEQVKTWVAAQAANDRV